MYKLSIDAMSGDLGSSIVVEACEMFMKNHHDVELYVTGKKEELETLAFFLYNICLEHNWPLEKDNEIDEFYDN